MDAHTHATIVLENGQTELPIDEAGGPGHVFLYHGSCSKCHHFHTARQLKIPFDQTVHVQFPCEHCNQPLFGAGRTSTHASLSSVLTSSSWNVGSIGHHFIDMRNNLFPLNTQPRLQPESTSAAAPYPTTTTSANTDEAVPNEEAPQGMQDQPRNRSLGGTPKQMIARLLHRVRGRSSLFSVGRSSRRERASVRDAFTMTDGYMSTAAAHLPAEITRQPPSIRFAVRPSRSEPGKDLHTRDHKRITRDRVLSRRRELTLRKRAIEQLRHGGTGPRQDDQLLPPLTHSNNQDRARASTELTRSLPSRSSSPLSTAGVMSPNLFAFTGTHFISTPLSPFSPTNDRPAIGVGANALTESGEDDIILEGIEPVIAAQRPERFLRRHHSSPVQPLHDILYFIANSRPEVIHALNANERAAMSSSNMSLVREPNGERMSTKDDSADASPAASSRQVQPTPLQDGANGIPQQTDSTHVPNINGASQAIPTESTISLLQLAIRNRQPDGDSQGQH